MIAMPPPGFYWARISRARCHWQPVEVTINLNVRPLRGERFGAGAVVEWGAKLEPPGADRRLTLFESERITLCIGVAEGESAIEPDEEKALIAAIARVTRP